MQSEKFQPSGQRLMPETPLIVLSALSVYPRVGISRSALVTDGRFYLSLIITMDLSQTKQVSGCLGSVLSLFNWWVSFAPMFQCRYFCVFSCLFYLSINFDFYVSNIMHL